MPYRYRYIADRHLLLESLFAEITFDQLVALKTQQRDREIGGLGLRALVDLRQAFFKVEPSQVRAFADWMRKNLPGQLDTRSALLSTAPVETGLSLLYAADMQRSKTVEVFTELAPALEWLDLSPEILAEHRDIILLDEDVPGR